MTNTTQKNQIQGKPKTLLGESFDSVYNMIADENFGCRDLGDVPKKIVYNKSLSEKEWKLVEKISKERLFYLDEEEKYREIIDKVRDILGGDN